MGNKIKIKLIILCALFLATSAFVYSQNKTYVTEKKSLHKDYFTTIPGYKLLNNKELSEDHLNMLKLDDYLFADYGKRNAQVNLYIGYYYSAKKAYASHSPLICYPSQGWEINNKATTHSLRVGSHTVNYEEIITSFGEHKELVLYWYQSHLQTNTQVYKNKIAMGYNKLVNKDEQHGFVRVSVPIADSTYEEAKTIATEFIETFYPQFIDFIKES